MRIVVDTNIVISGIFFGGYPLKVLLAIINNKAEAYATPDIVNEYENVTKEMIELKGSGINSSVLGLFIISLKLIEPKSHIEVCRDADDSKFIECAKDSKAVYIVSGDKDLLSIKKYSNIQIITAKDFTEEFL